MMRVTLAGEKEKEKGMERRRNTHIGRQTTVKSLTVDMRTTVEQYGPSHLHIRTEWHYHCTLLQPGREEKEG
jgi:hypothetical protein